MISTQVLILFAFVMVTFSAVFYIASPTLRTNFAFNIVSAMIVSVGAVNAYFLIN